MTAGAPEGVTGVVDAVDFAVLLVADVALVVELVDEFEGCGVDMISPPLDAFQYTGAPARGDPSSAMLTDMTDDWVVKIVAGPPVIVSTLG